MVRAQLESLGLDRDKAKRHAQRLLIERRRCHTRIYHIDGKLKQLSRRYGLHLDLDDNYLVEDSL